MRIFVNVINNYCFIIYCQNIQLMNDVYHSYILLSISIYHLYFSLCDHEINHIFIFIYIQSHLLMYTYYTYTYFNRMFAMTHLKIVLGQEMNVILKPCISSMR